MKIENMKIVILNKDSLLFQNFWQYWDDQRAQRSKHDDQNNNNEDTSQNN